MTESAVLQSIPNPKISFALLCGSGSVKHDTMNSLILSLQQCAIQGIEYDLITIQGLTGIDSARNIITDMFLQRGFASHLMMIDDDMAWAADLPIRMLRENVDIIGVPYKRKNIKNCRWTVNHPIPDVEVMKDKPYLMKVESIGTGMMMVNRRVFDNLNVEKAFITEEKPPIGLYFRHTIDKNGKLKSEDFSFCEKARDAGHTIWAWTDEEIAHIGNYAYTGRYSDVIGGGTYEGKREQLRIMLE